MREKKPLKVSRSGWHPVNLFAHLSQIEVETVRTFQTGYIKKESARHHKWTHDNDVRKISQRERKSATHFPHRKKKHITHLSHVTHVKVASFFWVDHPRVKWKLQLASSSGEKEIVLDCRDEKQHLEKTKHDKLKLKRSHLGKTMKNHKKDQKTKQNWKITLFLQNNTNKKKYYVYFFPLRNW